VQEGNIYWNRELFDLVEYGAEDVGIFEKLRRLFWVRLRLRWGDEQPTLFVATAHYTYQDNERERTEGLNPRLDQARKTVTALNRLSPVLEPLLFMGDLNDARHPVRILREGGLIPSFEALGRVPSPTSPVLTYKPGPPEVVDWMLHRGPIRPMTSEVVDFYVGDLPPSDHRPLLTTYRLA
jgi:endonuclease/exonuclease/phosphatase (EEP) superfamily protein YafD